MIRPRLAAGLLVALAALPGGTAGAEDRSNPFVTPQHDVDVSYLVAGPRAPADPSGLGVPPPPAVLSQRMRWSAALWRQRLDPAGNAYMISDYRARRILVVDTRSNTATLMPLPAAGPGGGVQAPGQRATGRYERLGTDSVAGTACTEWRTRDDQGAGSEVCLTADGVLLRARQHGQVLLVASSVSYRIQDPALFSAPPGTPIASTSP